MIIQRLASALKRQDWFQVMIEILIVIVGIFLGLQVQAIYENGQNRAQEKFYVDQLHSEIMEGTDEFETFFAPRIIIRDHLHEVLESFLGKSEISTLTSMHCYAIFASHIYNSRIVSMPTITELISSGKLSIIEDQNLRLSLSKYEQGLNVLDRLVDGVSLNQLVLARKYPDLIMLDPEMRAVLNYNDFEHQCDFTAMNETGNFKNDLIDNSARLSSFVETLDRQRANLASLHNDLDDILNVTHADSVP